MPKASTLADDLWPFLLPRVQRVNRTGGGNGNGAGGGTGGSSSSTPAGLTDVALAGTSRWADASLPSVNERIRSMWHRPVAAPPTSPVLALTSQARRLALKRQAAGGISADTNGLYSVKPLDSGLNLSTSGLAVGAGDGIDVFGGTVAVDSTEIVDTDAGLALAPMTSIYG